MLKTSKLASGITALIAGEESWDAPETLLITHQSGGAACNYSKHRILKIGEFLVGEATVSLPEIAFVKLDKHTVLFAHTEVGYL